MRIFNYSGDSTGTGGGVDQRTMCFAKVDNSVIAILVLLQKL